MLAAALVTRYSPDDPRLKIPIAKAKICLPEIVRQWGQVQIMGGGDKLTCSALIKPGRYTRDCTFIKVCSNLWVESLVAPLKPLIESV